MLNIQVCMLHNKSLRKFILKKVANFKSLKNDKFKFFSVANNFHLMVMAY